MTLPEPPNGAALVPLKPHPAVPAPALALHASARRTADGGLELRYQLSGPLAALRLPEPAPPAPRDGLWQHTCFEAFVGAAGARAYREFNFAPSGAWAAYAFHDTRQRQPAELPAPRASWAGTAEGLVLTARLGPAALPPAGPALEIGLTAVIETFDGAFSYWALRHPAPAPDFHHRGGWSLCLPPAHPRSGTP